MVISQEDEDGDEDDELFLNRRPGRCIGPQLREVSISQKDSPDE